MSEGSTAGVRVSETFCGVARRLREPDVTDVTDVTWRLREPAEDIRVRLEDVLVKRVGVDALSRCA